MIVLGTKNGRKLGFLESFVYFYAILTAKVKLERKRKVNHYEKWH